METNYKKKILILGSLCLVFLGLIFSLSFLGQRRVTQERAYGAGTLSLTSSVANPTVGQEFWVEARVNTAEKVSMFDLVISYNKAIVDVMPAGEGDVVVNSLYDCRTVKTDDNNGKIILQGAIKNVVCGTARFEDNPPAQVTGNVLLAKFKVKGIAAGNPQISFGNPNIIYGFNPNQADTIITLSAKNPLVITIVAGSGATATPGGPTATPTVTGSPTATPTTPPGGNPVLNFKIKFQGVTVKRADQKVKVIVKKGSLNKTFGDVSVVSDDNGIYSGSVTLTEVPAGGNYKIFIKGPKHLARKFCENNQAGRCVGSGKVTLAAGANTFDFSKIVLEAGDLPNPSDSNKQDGVVNSVDYSLWKSRIGNEDADSLAVADVNFDGIVNFTGDWMLMRVTLETKYEEEE